MKLVSIKRVLFHFIAFFIVMNLFFWSRSLWKSIDELLVSKISYNTENLSKVRSSIAVVDVDLLQNNPSDTEGCISCQRKILVNILKTINAENQKPDALILDFSFSNDSTLVKTLKKEISELKLAGVKVYASYDTDEYDAVQEDLQDFFVFDIQQSQEIYDLLTRRLHTNYTVKFKDDRWLIDHAPVKYLKNRNIDNSIDSVAIESLIKRVHLDRTEPEAKVPYTKNYIVPLGEPKAIDGITYKFFPGKRSDLLGSFQPHPKNIEKTLNFQKKSFIIVGDLKNDRIRMSKLDFPGPHLVAWTLSEEIAPELQKIVRQPESNVVINLIQTIVFSLLTVLLFAFLFKYVKRFQTKPWVLAFLSILITFGFLVLYVFLFLSQNKTPLLGLTTIGIIVAALFSWRFAYKFLVTGIAEGSQKYDVFISYSHGNNDWVKKNVFEPLENFTINGKKLNIFFDVKSIGIGEQFTAKYMWGIVDSKVFIPIISEEYYGKYHCKNEMDLAVKRSVEKLILLMPIVYSYDCVPEAFQHINFTDITVNPNFIDAIKEELTKSLS